MKDKMMKMLMDKKRSGKELQPGEKEAKMKVIKDLRQMAEQIMKDDIKGMKKVTVASPTQEGLKEGLEKAEDILESNSEEMSEESEESEESEDMSEEYAEESEDEEMSEEEINAKLAELMAKKDKLKLKA